MLRFAFTFLLLVACARNLPGAVFLHLDDVPGESTSSRHSGWIEVLSYSWGVQKTTNLPPSLSALQFQKNVDRSSPRLLLNVSTGRVFPSGLLEVLRTDDAGVRRLLIKLKNVQITSYQTSGAADAAPQDSFSLGFSSVQWTYTEVNDGRPLRDISTSYDLRTQTGAGGEVPADSDNDGLPDAYETLYGLNIRGVDADEDLDKDGMTNIEEFRAGTLPNKSESTFSVSGARSADGAASLNWEPAPNKTYRLMGTPSPDQPFQFIRFLTEAEAAAGELNLNTAGNFQFFILQVD
jgi:type VI secretion system secreted protein Hcp